MHHNDELLKADGFNEAIIGTGIRFNDQFVVYDYDKVMEILMKDGMTREEAVEHWDFNIRGSWVGEETPCFMVHCNKNATVV